MEGASVKVHYFDIYGRAAAMRMLLAHKQVAFDNVRYTFEQWGQVKNSGNFEFAQLPALEFEGQWYCQSAAILRFLGKKYGYYSDDAHTAWRMDSTVDACNDIGQAFFKFAMEKDEDKKKSGAEAFCAKDLPAWCAVMEKRITANSSPHHFVGDNYSIADFAVAGWAYATVYNAGCEWTTQFQAVLDNYPKFKAYLLHLGENPIKAFLAKRPQPRPY